MTTIPTKNIKNGFTLIELLVVIAIIGMLASIVMGSLNDARQNSKVAKILAEIREVKKVVVFYVIDTDRYPTTCIYTCVQATDPFASSMGVPGWNGPYYKLWNFTHPWGGHVGYQVGGVGGTDGDGDGALDYWIFLDDDRPGTNTSDNGGQIPVDVLLKIDRAIDDGNLNTGNVRANGGSWPNIFSVVGEMLIKLDI